MPELKGSDTFVVNQNVIDVLSNNPSLTLSRSQLRSIVLGTTVWKRGCVKALRYQEDSKDLHTVQLGSHIFHGGNASNLKDFREVFEQAACCGFEVGLCHVNDKEINMVWVYPCKCTCDKQH